MFCLCVQCLRRPRYILGDIDMQGSEFSWTPRKIDYDLEEGRHALPSLRIPFTDYHPLKPILVTEITDLKSKRKGDSSSTKSNSSEKLSSKSVEFIDPLSALAAADPLSHAVATTKSSVQQNKETEKGKPDDEDCENIKPWNEKRFDILKEYSLNENLSAQMFSLLCGGEKLSGRNAHYNSGVDQLRSKLKRLDDIVTGNAAETKAMRQQQFIDQIHENIKGLNESWRANQKVNALKIAIQSGKMLGNSSVMQFYPSKFVMVVDILQQFGKLVFERILSMCGGMSADSIDPDKVPENAKEICLNWMMKISSIRELLPRILTEASILRCLRFLNKDECNATLVRLANMTKGIGDPLVSLYVRAYLCIVGTRYAPKFRGHLFSNYYQVIETFKQIHTTSIQNEIAMQKVDMGTYLSVFVPGLEWILTCVCHKASGNQLQDVLGKCTRTGNNLMILRCIISSFSPELIAPVALNLCSAISESDDKFFPKASVFSVLGRSVAAATMKDDHKKQLLTETWKYLSLIQDVVDYMSCVVPWSEYASKNCKKRDVNAILGDILRHLTPDRAFQKFYPELLNILKGILSNVTDFIEIFSMDKFLAFLDLFQKEEAKLKMCDCVIEHFRKTPAENTTDPLVISGMMYICQGLHESVSSLTPDSDVKSVTFSICSVIQKVSFGRDFEQQLNFYVECRASFYKLDGVLANLVYHVNNLSTTATKIVKHNHTSKTSAFIRACAAYSFITIPSISHIETRLKLYLASGQAALINRCITQADAMFYAFVSQIKDFTSVEKPTLPSSSLFGFVCNFLSTLLTVPDHPEQGMLYLLRGLLNVVSSESSHQVSTEVRMKIFVKVLSLLSAYSQDKYIYQVDHVDSNEHLYSSDPKFEAEILKVAKTLLTPIIDYVASTSQFKPAERASIAIALLSASVAHGDASTKHMRVLICQMWNAAVQTGSADEGTMKKILQSMKMNSVNADIARTLSLHPNKAMA